MEKDIVKNYVENKEEYLYETYGPKNTNNKDPEARSKQMKKFLQDELLEEEVADQAIALSLGVIQPPDYDEISQRIEFFLRNAPEEVAKIRPNKDKGYYPLFQNLNLNDKDLIWSKFLYNFETVFPFEYPDKENEQDDPSRPSYDDFLDPDNNYTKYGVMMYKEFQKNQSFYAHYLAQEKKFMQEGLNQMLQDDTYNENRQPIYEVDYSDDEEFQLSQAELEKAEKNEVEVDEKETMSEFLQAGNQIFRAGGKRKTCVCTVGIRRGRGIVTINHIPLIKYFTDPTERRKILYTVEQAGLSCLIDAKFLIRGGGTNAQAEAGRLAISRAMVRMCPSLKTSFRSSQALWTDLRQVEMKKPGLYKARKKYPYRRR